MSSGIFGLCFCILFSIVSAVTVGIPYWYYASFQGVQSYSGLWQACSSTPLGKRCVFSSFGYVGWWDAIRILEVIGVIFGLIGSLIGTIAVCAKKARGMYVGGGLSALFGAGCIASALIIVAVKSTDPFLNANAGLYLNIIGCVGMGMGGLILLCTRGVAEQHGSSSGLVLQPYGQQHPPHAAGFTNAMPSKY